MRYYISSYFFTLPVANRVEMEIASIFGIGLGDVHRFTICDNLEIELNPPEILFLTGTSGAGKTVVFKILKKLFRPAVDIDNIRVHRKKNLVEHFKGCSISEALYYLSIAGLADAFIFLRKPSELSDGQFYRFKLALALSKRKKYIFADQFLDNLDRATAKVIAYNVRKFANKFNISFILATPNCDIIDQLNPDVIVDQRFGENPVVEERKSRSVKR